MEKQKIFIGSDHRGFELKLFLAEFLRSEGYEVSDMGPKAYDKDDDYPDYAEKVCEGVVGEQGLGVLICGSGQGMVRTANKFRGVYAALCWNEESARLAKEDGNPNVLCLSASLTSGTDAKRIVEVWLNAEFLGHARHKRRIDKVKDIEKKQMK